MMKFIVALILASSTAYIGSSLLLVTQGGSKQEMVASSDKVLMRDGLACSGGAMTLPSCQ